jgi:hypothetical protein
MNTIEHLDDFEAGFFMGWFRARGVYTTPSAELYREAARDLAAFARETQMSSPLAADSGRGGERFNR